MTNLPSIQEILSALELAPNFLSVVSIIVSFALLYLTRILAKETRLTRQISERADVWCAIQPSAQEPRLAILAVTNTGSATATDVIVDCSSVTDFFGEKRKLNFNASVLLPGTSWKSEIGFFINFPKGRLEAKISFRDRFGTHHRIYEQDVTTLFDMRQVQESPLFDMAKTSETMTKELERIRHLISEMAARNNPPMEPDVANEGQ